MAPTLVPSLVPSVQGGGAMDDKALAEALVWLLLFGVPTVAAWRRR